MNNSNATLKNKLMSGSPLSMDASLNDNNARGWLESTNLRTLSQIPSIHSHKLSQQDILRTVSDEVILKLTQLTSILPEISTSSSSNQHYHYHSHKEPKIIASSPLKEEEKQASSPVEDDTKLSKVTTEAKDIVNQFYQQEHLLTKIHSQPVKRGRSNTQIVTPAARETSPRRHSFDSFMRMDPHTILQNASAKATLENKPVSEQTKTIMFDYQSLPAEIQQLLNMYECKGKLTRKNMTVYSDDGDAHTKEDNSVSCHALTVGNHSQVDYKLNPVREIAILTTVPSDNVGFTKLIQTTSTDQGSLLLDLHVSLFHEGHTENKDIEEEFTDVLEDVDKKLKAIHSFVQESDFQLQDQLQILRSLNLFEDPEDKPRLARTHSQPSFQPSSYMTDETSSISSFDSSISISSSISSSSGIILRPTRDMLSRHPKSWMENHRASPQMTRTKDPFSYRQGEIERLVKSLASELNEFITSLENTEDLVADVQVDMDHFRTRMETYIKDIPESHYSTLRKIEVEIESILSKRAKNPLLETGYTLLSYLLTLFALFFWVLIYMFKVIERIVKLPFKLYKGLHYRANVKRKQ